ncbi:hypothetical protein Patl1_22214 [Pistacia atlantica]|uniref:Uncharacterized protein n=1 Tax=Pistacia atlantica TaxID=434234 RepID=A0ACC1BJV6_9ROSI|nr:hypothetical protein Patl1_22214 [Pistacia atlantica]
MLKYFLILKSSNGDWPTAFRLVCSSAVARLESTISHLQSQNGSQSVLDDPSFEDCIIVITLVFRPATNKDHYNVNREEEEEEEEEW